MSGVLRAIPTRYKGILFRSKLEADWAISLDGFGIEWEYEPEGRYWGDVYYAPDFWLPESEQWFEVKGQLMEADIKKWSVLLEHWSQPRSRRSTGELRVALGTTLYHEIMVDPDPPARFPALIVGFPRGLMAMPETVIAEHLLGEYPEDGEEVVLIPSLGFVAIDPWQTPSEAMQKADWVWNLGRVFPCREGVIG